MELWVFLIGVVVILAIVVLRLGRRDDRRDPALHAGPYDAPGEQEDVEAGNIRRRDSWPVIFPGGGGGGGTGGGGGAGSGV